MATTISDGQKTVGSTAQNGNHNDQNDGLIINKEISLAATLMNELIEVRTRIEEPIQKSRSYTPVQCILNKAPKRPGEYKRTSTNEIRPAV